MKVKLILFIGMIIFSISVQAQILGRVMDRAKNKLERKIEDKIVEEISEEIARRAFKPVEKAIEDALRQKYQDSLGGGEPIDWEKASASYAMFLSNLNKNVNLPDQYSFDVSQEVEVIDYDKKRSFVKMHYSGSEAVIGMENTDDEMKNQLIVIDVTRDVVVLYSTDKKGTKTAQAIPGMMGMTSAFANNAKVDTPEDQLKIKKTGKTKKIAGFECIEYQGENSEEYFEMYSTEKFPVQMEKTFKPYLQKFTPASYYENTQYFTGMILQSENTRKTEKDKKFLWTTKKITEKSFEIKKADYTFNQVYTE